MAKIREVHYRMKGTSMSRIQALEPQHASEPAKPLLDVVHGRLGVIPNLFKVAAHSPATLKALLGFTEALSEGTLGAKARESIALAVAQANACDYCLSAHSALGSAAGLSDRDIADARQGRASDPKLCAILAFARALVENRGHITPADLAQLRDYGITDSEIVETVANAAINIFTNYLNHVADTDIDFPVVRADLPAAA